jgi:hypothetical protein
MKAMIDGDGYLKIECGSIIESLSESDLRTFAKYAVFQDHLLRGVVDAIVDSNMWVDDDEGPWWFDSETFNRLRMKLIPLLPEIAAKAVQHLDVELRRARADAKEWREACWKLERDWPQEYRPPKPPEYHQPLTKEQARAYLTALEAKLGATAEAKEQP